MAVRGLLVVLGLSVVAVSGCWSLGMVCGLLIAWLLLLMSTGFMCMGFSSCGSWAWFSCSMWHLTGPGIELLPLNWWILNLWTTRKSRKADLLFKKKFKRVDLESSHHISFLTS